MDYSSVSLRLPLDVCNANSTVACDKIPSQGKARTVEDAGPYNKCLSAKPLLNHATIAWFSYYNKKEEDFPPLSYISLSASHSLSTSYELLYTPKLTLSAPPFVVPSVLCPSALQWYPPRVHIPLSESARQSSSESIPSLLNSRTEPS